MKTPIHWKSKNLISLILYPLGCLYGLATALRLKLYTPEKVSSKVICIGNLTAGGTGKTPTAVAVAELLQQHGHKPYFITRGYGGTLQNVIVDAGRHTAREVGDEPLLLARQAPVVVNKNRYQAALKAEKNGADFIIMDDGFQNPLLYKDLSLIVVDGGFGFGNEFCIPAGPLREFLPQGLTRASALAIIGEDRFNLTRRYPRKPVFRGKMVPVSPPDSRKNIVAFAGIGRPEKFYQSLKELGFNLLLTYDFPDHHFYEEKELLQLISTAQSLNAELYTTAKDFVKIPSVLQKNFKVLEIKIVWSEPEKLADFLINN